MNAVDPPFGSPAVDLSYSPDGRYLAVTGVGGFMIVYILEVDELVAEAESRLTRGWTNMNVASTSKQIPAQVRQPLHDPNGIELSVMRG